MARKPTADAITPTTTHRVGPKPPEPIDPRRLREGIRSPWGQPARGPVSTTGPSPGNGMTSG